MKLCDFGCGKPAIKTFKNGKHCCSNNVAGCSAHKEKTGKGVSKVFKEKGNSFWKNGHPKGATGTVPHNKGKTLEECYGPDEAERIRNIHSEAGKRQGGPCGNMTDEQKEEHRQRSSLQAYARHASGWDNKAGRCKKYHYFSPIAGDVTLDGSWELLVAQWLDTTGATWRRNRERFKYTHPNGNVAHYTPDFWIEHIGYVEVKGYETDLDRCKWSQFPHTLFVWKKNDINIIRNWINHYD